MFGLDRFIEDCVYSVFGLYRIVFYSVFGLDRFRQDCVFFSVRFRQVYTGLCFIQCLV